MRAFGVLKKVGVNDGSAHEIGLGNPRDPSQHW